MARVGIVFQTDVNGVGAVIHRGLQGRQVAGGTKQLHRFITAAVRPAGRTLSLKVAEGGVPPANANRGGHFRQRGAHRF